MTTASKQNASIVSGIDFDPTKDVTFAKAKVNDKGGKSIGVLNAATKKGLYISSPLMLTWGLNENEPFDGKSGPKTYDFTLQFPNDEYKNETVEKFLKNFKALEEHIKNQAIANSRDWLGKAKMTPEVVDALWSPMIKYPKDQQSGEFDYSRPPQLRVKVPYWDGVFNVEIYDVEQNLLFPKEDGPTLNELITKGINMATVIQCGGVWVASGKFGVTWRLFQAVVKPRESLKGKCHIMLGAEDKAKLMAETDDTSQESSKEKTVDVVDSDEDDEEQEEEEEVSVSDPVPEPEPEPEPDPEPEPKAAKPKRVVKKKQ
mgnify:CR=1 FL=1